MACYVSVSGISGHTGVFGLSVSHGASMSVVFFSGGPGTIGYAAFQGPADGVSFLGVTLAQGAFPFGWFYGIDIGWFVLLNQIAVGYPFLVGLSACGSVVV